MTLPSDIPVAVWATAEAVGEAIYGRHERGFVMWPLVPQNGDHPRLTIARAIMAEREAILNAANVYLIMQYGIGALGNPIDRGRIAAIRNGDAS